MFERKKMTRRNRVYDLNYTKCTRYPNRSEFIRRQMICRTGLDGDDTVEALADTFVIYVSTFILLLCFLHFFYIFILLRFILLRYYYYALCITALCIANILS